MFEKDLVEKADMESKMFKREKVEIGKLRFFSQLNIIFFQYNVEKDWLNISSVHIENRTDLVFLREIKDFVLFFLDLIFNTV